MRVLFFAHLKDITGRSEIAWPGAGPFITEALWERLLASCPALRTHRPVVRLAQNGEYAMPDAVFQDGDEIALIPPVSGG